MPPFIDDPPFPDDGADFTLRCATAADLDALRDLMCRAHPDETIPSRAELARLQRSGWLLVAECPHRGLLGAVHVRIDRKIGDVSLLTMDPDARSHALATRLLGVADALCAAFGCAPRDQPASHATP
jgi:N-acetylglutamate synthase-like GNAT family acetyltransferase